MARKTWLVGFRPRTAVDLGVSKAEVRVAVHRLRSLFGAVLRDEISNTANRPEEVDAEIRFLVEALQTR